MAVCGVPLHTKLHMPNKFVSSTQRKKIKSIFCTTTKVERKLNPHFAQPPKLIRYITQNTKSLKLHTFSNLLPHQISGTIIRYYSYYYHIRSLYSHHAGITDGKKLPCTEMEIK